jgi:NADPH-dependent 2,4-dienoyl-CoA reductase/sulfur reductase-like enzyme
VIGGGPVGTEVAAEIAEACPDKKVTVIHNKAEMVAPGYSEAFYQKAAELLEELKINYVTSRFYF